MNPDKLFDYLEGRLAPSERAALEEGLLSDKQLQREFAVARQIHAGMRGDSREVILPPAADVSEQGRKMAIRIGVAFMILMAVMSLYFGSKKARQHNHFSWGPIIEVAILFAGIFITMVPALMLLKQHAAAFGISRPAHFFWLTGCLSSFLDNAPTYLTFLSLAQGLGLSPQIVGVPANLLLAISAGAVIMGANTYIGNGPNFMVKAIADHAGCRTPSFFGYMLYALAVLFPLYGVVYLVFFR